MTTELSAVGLDVLIECHDGYCYLAVEVHKQCNWTTTVMCKANADEVLRIGHSLASISDDIQKWYDHWKNKEFTA